MRTLQDRLLHQLLLDRLLQLLLDRLHQLLHRLLQLLLGRLLQLLLDRLHRLLLRLLHLIIMILLQEAGRREEPPQLHQLRRPDLMSQQHRFHLRHHHHLQQQLYGQVKLMARQDQQQQLYGQVKLMAHQCRMLMRGKQLQPYRQAIVYHRL